MRLLLWHLCTTTPPPQFPLPTSLVSDTRGQTLHAHTHFVSSPLSNQAATLQPLGVAAYISTKLMGFLLVVCSVLGGVHKKVKGEKKNLLKIAE